MMIFVDESNRELDLAIHVIVLKTTETLVKRVIEPQSEGMLLFLSGLDMQYNC
jgi:hypothetical protein